MNQHNFGGIDPSDLDILHNLRRLIEEAEGVRSLDIKIALDASSSDVFWKPLRTGLYNNHTFEIESICEVIPNLIINAGNKYGENLQAYASVLLLRAYATGTHLDANNQFDNYVTLGRFVSALHNANYGTLHAASKFVIWLQKNNRINAIHSFYYMGATLLGCRALSLMIRDVMQEVDEMDDCRTTDIAESKRWLLRLDLNGSASELEAAWGPPITALAAHQGILRMAQFLISRCLSS